MLASRVSVAIVFSVLGVSFIASTALLIYEFREVNWVTLVVTHGHLFFFFPVFGLLTLFALYLPAVVFTDLLWTKVYSGQNRFLLGCILMAALSTGVAKFLDGPPRSIWEVAPAALAADKGDPAEGRLPILDVLDDLRQRAQVTVGLSRFARACAIDPLLEPPPEMLKKRYCFPAKSLLNGVECCRVQDRFREAVMRLQQDASARSMSARVDASVFLPLKIFFVLIVLAVGALLAIARESLDVHYRNLVPGIERGVVVGAMSMLCWTAMDYGYQQTANVLFGRMTSGPQLRLSLVIAPWAMLITFYFLRRLGKEGETVVQIASVITAAVAVLSYESFNDWIARVVGPGMDAATLSALLAIAAVGILTIRMRRGLGTADMSEAAP